VIPHVLGAVGSPNADRSK